MAISFCFVPLSRIVIQPSPKLVLFIFFSSIIFLIFGVLLETLFPLRKYHDKINRCLNVRVFYFFLFLFMTLFLIDSAHSDFMFPGLKIIGIKTNGYFDFGIKGLQGFLNAFYLAMMLILMVSNTKFKKYFFVFLFFYPILIFSRQVLISFLLQTMVCGLIFYPKVILKNKKKVIFIIISLVIMFGVLGNIRSKSSEMSGQDYFKNVAQINTAGNNVPSILLWGYMYIASPLSNLQYNLDNTSPSYKVIGFFDKMIPNIFRDYFKDTSNKIKLISPNFNVSTAYINSYVTFGWLGIYIYFAILLFAVIFFRILAYFNLYFLFCYVVIVPIVALTIFDNLLFYLPVIFQIFIFFFVILCGNIFPRLNND